MNCKLERLVRRSVCKNCGEPIGVGNDGCWVHDDPDEDPAVFDYGWARCLPKSEDDFENYAEPNAGHDTRQRENNQKGKTS